MAQHFLLSSAARTLSLTAVLRLSDREAEGLFIAMRWPEGIHCPHCGSVKFYDCRKANGTARWRCSERQCRKDFTVTSGTLFASHKLPLQTYLAAIAIFVNEVKGKSMLALSRDLGCQYKTAFVLAHKLREAMATEVQARPIGGDGKTVEIDGGYFGGYVKPANRREDRKDRRRFTNQNGKRQCVVIVRERRGHSAASVFKTEAEAVNFIRSKVKDGTVLHADEGSGWNALHSKFEMYRINHQEAYSTDESNTNAAEGFFSRLRRAEIGHHHHIAGRYLVRYAEESAWREDNRRMHNRFQIEQVAKLAMHASPSIDFRGYWQRSAA
jgi:transposase-like protein